MHTFSSPDISQFAADCLNPADALEAAELAGDDTLEAGNQSKNTQAVLFLMELIGRGGELRTVINRVVLLRFLMGYDTRPLAAIAHELGVSRPRVTYLRNALAHRLQSKGVRVRRRERLGG